MPEPRQVGYTTNPKLAGELLSLAGSRALDVGCGEGGFTCFLAKSGANATGIDIRTDALQRAAERAKADGVNVAWQTARAEELPFADASYDIVFFTNSLHHVAPDRMNTAIAEAARVLAPGGALYVMEPVAEGPYFEAMRPVNDEREARGHALAAVRSAATSGLAADDELIFLSHRRFDSYDDYVARQTERSEKRGRILADLGHDGRTHFESLARHEDGALLFDQMTRICLLRKGA